MGMTDEKDSRPERDEQYKKEVDDPRYFAAKRSYRVTLRITENGITYTKEVEYVAVAGEKPEDLESIGSDSKYVSDSKEDSYKYAGDEASEKKDLEQNKRSSSKRMTDEKDSRPERDISKYKSEDDERRYNGDKEENKRDSSVRLQDEKDSRPERDVNKYKSADDARNNRDSDDSKDEDYEDCDGSCLDD